MKRKFEDQLLRLAFGDLTSEEAEMVRRQAAGDPEAQRLLSECAAMRADLKRLNEIPEEQLSTERLRSAILERGLKREVERGSFLGWAWAPVTVALVAFSVAMMRHNANPVPLNVDGFNANALASKVKTPVLSVRPRPTEPVVANEAVDAAAAQTASSAQPSQPDDQSDDMSWFESDAPVRTVAKRSEPAPRTSTIVDRAIVAVNNYGDAPADLTPSEPSKDALVLIANDSDDDTGARRATEVDNATDILISG